MIGFKSWMLLLLFNAAEASPCGEHLTFQHGLSHTILSPRYPVATYPASSNCTWRVSVPAYHRVEVTIVNVDLRGNVTAAQCNASDKVEFVSRAAVPYFDLKCSANGFELSMPFSKLQNPVLYPYTDYHLSNSTCKPAVSADGLRFASDYAACGMLKDQVLHFGLRRSHTVLSYFYGVFSLNVFNNDEFLHEGQYDMWQPSDIFFEVATPGSSKNFAIRAEECWYTATEDPLNEDDRYILLHKSCPTEGDPIVRYPSLNHQDRFSHTLAMDLPGPENRRYVHCQVKVCIDNPSACAKNCIIPEAGTSSNRISRHTGSLGFVSGTVKDAGTLDVVPNVQIKARNNIITRTTASATDGQYNVSLPGGSGYVVTTQASGYHGATMSNVEVSANQSTILEAVMLIKASYTGNGTASGTVRSSFTGHTESGVRLDFRTGIDTNAGLVAGSVTTNHNGDWMVNLSTGHYTASMSRPGFINRHMTILVLGQEARSNQNGIISPDLRAGIIRIVLSWGSQPMDLDSHLTGPDQDGTGRFHVRFNQNKTNEPPPLVSLDADKRDYGHGPETITINSQRAGPYRYFVQDFTNRERTSSTALANSGAVVKVFIGDALSPGKTFHVPGTTGTLWTVFQLDQDLIKPINRMTHHSNPNIMPLS